MTKLYTHEDAVGIGAATDLLHAGQDLFLACLTLTPTSEVVRRASKVCVAIRENLDANSDVTTAIVESAYRHMNAPMYALFAKEFFDGVTCAQVHWLNFLAAELERIAELSQGNIGEKLTSREVQDLRQQMAVLANMLAAIVPYLMPVLASIQSPKR